MTLTEGQLLQGRYQIERLVARGGYGADTTDARCDPMEDHDPEWSPDGSHILFHANRSDSILRIFRMAVNGDDLRVLTDDERGAWAGDWSPDGKQIVFASDRAGALSLYILDLDSGIVTPIPGVPAGAISPSWDRY